MSLACHLHVEQSQAGRRALVLGALVAAAGLLLTAAQLWAGPTLLLEDQPLGSALAGGLCALLAVLVVLGGLSGRVAARVSARGQLAINANGEVRWLVAGAHRRPGAVGSDEPQVDKPFGQPVSLRRVARLPGLIVLVLASSDEAGRTMWRHRTPRLLIGQDGHDPEAWRRLNVWLCWLERGQSQPAA